MTDEHNVVATPTNEGGGSGGSTDPLDAITDVEQLRERAKGYRAERNEYRSGKRKADNPAPAAEPQSEFLTRRDQVRIATKEAKGKVKPEIAANWDKVIEYVPARYQNAETPDEIAKAMELAHEAWQKDPENQPKGGTPAADLQTSPGVQGGSGAPPKPAQPTDQRDRFSRPKGPTEWYPAKQQ